MNITKIDYLNYAINAKKTRDEKLKWKPELPSDFLDHAMPILAAIPPQYNDKGKISTKAILAYLHDLDVLSTPNGDMTGKNVLRLIMFLYFCKRGDLIHGSQNKNPRFATLTPLLMYAHKLYNDIPYSSWVPSNTALGYSLEGIINVKEKPTNYDVASSRQDALTYKGGVKVGQVAPITGYKCNITKLGEVELPKLVIIMTLQLWLSNASIRNTDSMILDPFDWDNVPDALDASVSPNIPEPKIVQEVGDDLWM